MSYHFMPGTESVLGTIHRIMYEDLQLPAKQLF